MTTVHLAPAASHDTAHHLSLFVEGLRDYSVVMLSPEGTIVSWNAGAAAIKGYEADEVLGRHFSLFYTPADIAAGKPALALQEATAKGRFEVT